MDKNNLKEKRRGSLWKHPYKKSRFQKWTPMILMLLFGSMAMKVVIAEMPISKGWEETHHSSIVVDMHNDTMMKVVDSHTWLPVVDIGKEPLEGFQLDLHKAQQGGLNVAFYAAYTADQRDVDDVVARTNSRSLALINALYWTIEQNQDNMILARNTQEIEAGLAEGKHVAVASLEGMYQFGGENSKALLRQYHDLGIRAAGLVWNSPNRLGAGANVANNEANAGLTEAGREIISEMNRLGILVDVSHMNEKTFFDTLETTQVPVIASHSGVDGVRPHVRNLSDEQLLQLKENGGVVSINFWRTALADPGSSATVKHIVDHIDYAVNLIGIDHVGLGSDFDGATMPKDLPDASYLPSITKELASRGYHQEEIKKIVGGNNQRVLKEAEKFAEKQVRYPWLQPPRLRIVPDVQMGEIVYNTKPTLSAKIVDGGDGAGNFFQYSIIVNGIAYQPSYHPDTGYISYQMERDLLGKGHTEKEGNFHVVTFLARNPMGVEVRETVIFYVL
ncbi:membrane dipeptidase [Tindallia magadiensis]|uniref:Membrane dipeptidase n=1 Tax=Tindallia magadiensis TaxID=69895 RepID=A0A1I3EHI0_9FIRM|nr:dipeptidase [Tindallia magadiensis]SFH98412.1 membrane dipeptidase [Tindallia magadiensis]